MFRISGLGIFWWRSTPGTHLKLTRKNKPIVTDACGVIRHRSTMCSLRFHFRSFPRVGFHVGLWSLRLGVLMPSAGA